MVKPKASIVYEAQEKRLDMHLQVFDAGQHRLIGHVGESFSCDMQVGILPYPKIKSNNDNAHVWHGYMDMHRLGNHQSQKVSFNSDRFQKDLTRWAVKEEISCNKRRMDLISNRLLCLKGASESHPEIPMLIQDVRPLLKRDLSPSEIIGMTKRKALALAKRILTANLLEFISQELKEHFQSDIPCSHHPVPIRLEERVAVFGKVIGLAMTSAMKTARHLHCLEQAHDELLFDISRKSKYSGSKWARSCPMHISSDDIEVEQEEKSEFLSDVSRSSKNQSGSRVAKPRTLHVSSLEAVAVQGEVKGFESLCFILRDDSTLVCPCDAFFSFVSQSLDTPS